MNKKVTYAILVLFLLIGTYAFSKWVIPKTFYLEENHVKTFAANNANCNPPLDFGVKNVKTDEATLYWEDDSGSAWEYIIQLPSDPYPTGAGTASTTKEVTVTRDHNNNNLQPGTPYEFYVRTDCGADGMSSWVGPYNFKTPCLPVNLPFTETFETNSTTLACWTIIDSNKDAVSPTGNNIWKQHTATPYEGGRAMYFKGDSSKKHDDWLISPAITMTGGIYAISYYYKTSALTTDENELEVLLSKNGIDVNQFTTVLLSKQVYAQSTYKYKTLYVQGITGDIHIAWHATSSKQTEIYLDMLSVEEIDCVGLDLDEINITDLKTDEITFEWEDVNNSNWEIYVQPARGGKPTGSGTLTNAKSVTITRTNGTGSGNLQPNVEYEFWVRSICGTGKTSNWIGPVVFRTNCVAQSLPFTEGFNSTSITFDCWQVINQNSFGGWQQTSYWTDCYEGDSSMKLNMAHPLYYDWLISPTFNLDDTKTYKLEYYLYVYYPYRYNLKQDIVLEVYVNNKSFFDENTLTKIGESDFTKLFPDQIIGDENPGFIKQTIYIQDIGDAIQLAWGATNISEERSIVIDNITFEEVSCIGPLKLHKKEETKDKAVIYWEDDMNKEWEYVVQKVGNSGVPIGKGIKTTTKENTITQEFNGSLLEPDTVYEYYVRAKCVKGQGSVEYWSDWEGPLSFRTTCTKMSLPFWEGFNYDSTTATCWRVDYANLEEGRIRWSYPIEEPYEGNRFARFKVNYLISSKSDNWLISPTFILDSNKKYRLTYHYNAKASPIDIEILASNSGVSRSDFSNILIAKTYEKSNWKKEEVVISDLGGDVNFAWRILTSGGIASNFSLDNVYLEELGCLHPEDLTVEDIKEDEVTISWDKDTNSEWEYIVQGEGKGRPTSPGISTNTPENVVSQDMDGNDLEPNMEYEFYVRVNCGGGTYSKWAGPYVFKTGVACKDSFNTPFWEGFNSNSETIDCWSYVINKSSDAIEEWSIGSVPDMNYEGNGRANFFGFDMDNKTKYDSWLISPKVKLDGEKYLLRYHYATLPNLIPAIQYDNQFEVLLSTGGVSLDQFTTIVVPIQAYNNNDWEWNEKRVYIEGIKGEINLAWHITSTGSTYIGIDNISLEQVRDCQEPYDVKIKNETSAATDITWKQEDGITEWEVIVVDYGEDETSIPIQTLKVIGNPEVSLYGLDSNKGYTIYIRSVCTDKGIKSNWSSPIDKIPVQTNVDCGQAKTIPVNPGPDWDKYVYGSFVGATISSIDLPSCNGWDTSQKKDIWFEFTAIEKVHVLKVLNLSMEVTTNSMFGVLYSQNCGSINSNSSLDCFEIAMFRNEDFKVFRDLKPGQKYYIRFVESSTNNSVLSFNLSITSPSIELSESGNLYSTDELVRDVFIKSNCEQVSDIEYTVDKSMVTSPLGLMIMGNPNTIGYFKNTKGKEIFPFEEGIVLNDADIDINAFGPYESDLKSFLPRLRSHNIDPDFENLYREKEVDKIVKQAILEFDFIPLTDSLQWEYLFASDCFDDYCSYNSFYLNGGGMVGSWIIDEETGDRTNVALTPQTEQPVGAMYIMDKELRCFDVNPDLIGLINDVEDTRYDKRKSPINFTGMTVPLQTKKKEVIPGHKYRIKIVVGSRCIRGGHDSAVFLNGGSFNTGNITLGSDLLIETNNALCYNQTAMIHSQTDVSDLIEKEYRWYKDDVLISGANTPDLEVSEAGEYKVVMKLTELNCAFTDTITVEVYPAISEAVHQAEAIVVCQYSLQETLVDLTTVENAMFAAVDRSIYTTGYYSTAEEAEAAENAIANAERYSLGKEPQAQTLYIRVENTETGCYEVFELHIQPEEGAVPEQLENVTVCSEYEFPATASHQSYYTEPAGGGKAYQAGDVLAEPGKHTIYLLQMNTEEGCYEETSFIVNITAPVTADVFEDTTLSCEYYELALLSEYNRYYTEPEGQGTELYAGMQIFHKQTVYVYASSEDDLCTDESSFTIDYEDCPIPRGISPNNDGLNDVFDLTPHGVESIQIYNRWGTEVYTHGEGYTTQWHGQNKNDKQLPDGTYYYVIQAHGKTRTGWVQINK